MTSELAPTSGELVSTSLVELALQQLRREMLSGEMQPGDRLVEEQVRQRFGISRAPLREALRLLAEQGLVEHLPRRGVRVATLSPTDVRELFELRDVLERHAVGLAVPGVKGRLDALRGELAAMRAATDAGDAFGAAEAHRRFHVQLVALARQRQLLLAYEPILLRLQLHMSVNLRREAAATAPSEGVRRHAVLLEALGSDDPAAVLGALERHGAQAYLG